MGEMSLERACEVLNRNRYRSYEWRVDHDRLVSTVGNNIAGSHQIYCKFDAIAIASSLERDAAPPADAGEGDAAYAAALRLVADALDDAAASDLPSIAVSQADLEQIRESLLAAAERGGGPGPATRRLFGCLAAVAGEVDDHAKIRLRNRFGVTEYVLAGVVRESARELALEAPR